jgi:Repeat of unknown function (DUF5648)
MAGDHFYTTNSDGELAPIAGYRLEGVACFVFGIQGQGTQPLFRWFRPKSGDHFYTLDPSGELAPSLGYRSEGIACYVFSSQQPNTIPLFRWFKSSNGDHFYTTDPSGELAPSLGYRSEGIACHVFSSQQPGTLELFRWFQDGLMSNFTFDAGISFNQKLRVMQRHAFAHFRARECNSLSPQERTNLLNAYQKAINHSVSTNPNENASSTIGGSQLWINFVNLFPLGDREIAQTLIHEMMHIAGYTHPQRCDQVTPPAPQLCNPIDVPGDNGLYYGTPPLRAELCIGGVQSDAGLLSLSHSRFLTHSKFLTLDGKILAAEEPVEPIPSGCQVLEEKQLD